MTPTQRGLTSVADHKAHALIRRLCGPSCVSHVYAPLPPGTPSALPGLLSMLPPPRSLLGFSQPAVSTSVSNTHSTHLKLCSGEQSLAALDCSYLPGLGSLFFPSQTMTSLGSQKPHQGTVEGLWPADNKRPGLGILGPQLEKQVLILNNGVISRSPRLGTALKGKRSEYRPGMWSGQPSWRRWGLAVQSSSCVGADAHYKEASESPFGSLLTWRAPTHHDSLQAPPPLRSLPEFPLTVLP